MKRHRHRYRPGWLSLMLMPNCFRWFSQPKSGRLLPLTLLPQDRTQKQDQIGPARILFSVNESCHGPGQQFLSKGLQLQKDSLLIAPDRLFHPSRMMIMATQLPKGHTLRVLYFSATPRSQGSAWLAIYKLSCIESQLVSHIRGFKGFHCFTLNI